ncbi:hypothetical protein [Streptomyces puniciscabiei]|uniref:hypothetical protein n=1 Tax=Streptomyces puniciscabiei TaxID=164348 RepID=UPI0033261025
MRVRTVGLITATLALLALVWVDWLVNPTAPQGLTFPLALSAVLAANVPLTLAALGSSAPWSHPCSGT